MKKRTLNILKNLFFLLLGVALLWISFRNVDLQELWEGIKNANYSWIILAIACAIISHCFRALRWNLLIDALDYKTRFSTTFYAVMIGYMANLVVPRMGEIARCGVLTKKEKIPFNALLGTVISERLFDLVVLILLLVTVILVQWQLLGDLVISWFNPLIESTTTKSVSLFIGLFVAFCLLLVTLWIFFRKKIQQTTVYQKIASLLLGLVDGMKTIKTMRRKGLFLFYTLMVWVFYVLMTWLPFYMLPETSHLDLAAGITFLAIGSLGIVAPVPGGIGAYHFIGKTLLHGFYHISELGAISFVTITHAAQTLMQIVAGGLSYFLLFFVDKKPPLNGNTTTNSER